MTQQAKQLVGATKNVCSTVKSEAAAHRVLVVANETIDGDALQDLIIAERDIEVHVVAPALNTRLRHWTSDEDRARREAGGRLAACVDTLDNAGIRVDGRVGDADPMRAIADALVCFDADELLIATHPEHRSNWLARDLVSRACDRFALPVAHIVVDHVAAPVTLAAAT
jgi:GNAT superfamily N-acetyltransferase